MLSMGIHAQGSLEKGIIADSKGLNDLAVGYYREAVDTNAEARLRLGMLLQHQEHFSEAAKWLTKAELDEVNWIPADIKAVDYLKETMSD